MRTFRLPSLKKRNNERKGKGPVTNVIDITLFLVPRAQRMDQKHDKNKKKKKKKRKKKRKKT